MNNQVPWGTLQDNNFYIYFYHPDHLGSSNYITDCEGKEHEHVEYTPYGELWVDKQDTDKFRDLINYKFTGKEWTLRLD